MLVYRKTLILPSATLAQRGAALLAAAGISAQTVRVRVGASRVAQPGCGWGLELDASRVAEATRVLARAGIASQLGGTP